MPGAGKTIIAATAIEHLQKTVQRQGFAVSYIYCSYQRRAENSVPVLIAAIIRQLVQQELGPVYEHISKLYDEHKPRGTRLSLAEMIKALEVTLPSCLSFHVVIDALDEFVAEQNSDYKDQDIRQLLFQLRDLQIKTNVNVMITCRPIPEVEDVLQNVTKLDIQANQNDVKLFVKGQTSRLPQIISGDPVLLKEAQDVIAEAAEGM